MPTQSVRIILMFIGFSLASISYLNSQVAINWKMKYGGESEDIGEFIIATSDGGYAIAGASSSSQGTVDPTSPFEDFWILKLDSNGEIEWDKKYGGSRSERAHAILQTNDGGYIVAGHSTSNDFDFAGIGVGRSDEIWLLKLKPNGDIEWKRNYGGSGSETPYAIDITNDGGYIIGGYSASSDGDVGDKRGASDMYVLKVDGAGDIEWSKVFGGTWQEIIYSIKQTMDGGYIAVGFTNSVDGEADDVKGDSDFWVLKLSKDGALEWEKTYGGSKEEVAENIIQTPDSGYVIVGYTFSDDGDVSKNNGSEDSWIVKLSNEGNILWEKTYGGMDEDRGYDIVQINSGQLVIAGRSRSSTGNVSENKGSTDVWVKGLNKNNGNILWEKSVGGSSPDAAYGIDKTTDGGFIVTGNSYSNNGDFPTSFGIGDICVVKFEPISLNVENSSMPSVTKVYPNPSKDYIQIEASDILNFNLQLFSIEGKQILSADNSSTLDISTLEKGIYLLQFTNLTNGKSHIQRVVKS